MMNTTQMISYKIGLRMNNTLLLLKDLYSIEYLDDARTAFSRLTKICISDDKKYWICEFTDCKYAVEKTKKEFENYLIGICNKEG